MLKAKNASFSDLVSAVIELSGMMVHYKSEGDIEAQSRLENLQEFLSAVQEYERSYPERGLEDFLQETALVSEVDEWKEGDVVSMMTVHCSKGLEFPVVFITGLEEGLFPLMRDGKADFEEERRLFYVGATRAMNRLYLTFAKRRREGLFSDTSRFITEIPRRMLEYWKGFGRVSSLSLPSSLVKPDGFAKAEKQASQITKAKTLFKRGDLVVHPQFGEGVVYSIEKRGEEDLLTIYFQGYGAKRIFPNKAHLTKITL
jgi:DNA helicase-2/ATP-dependent DNA helicase PcrA